MHVFFTTLLYCYTTALCQYWIKGVTYLLTYNSAHKHHTQKSSVHMYRQFIHFASAFIAIRSNQLTASSLARWSLCRPPSECTVNGHSFTTCNIVLIIPHSLVRGCKASLVYICDRRRSKHVRIYFVGNVGGSGCRGSRFLTRRDWFLFNWLVAGVIANDWRQRRSTRSTATRHS